MEILSEKSVSPPLHVNIGDTLHITYNDKFGASTELESFKFDDVQVIDRIVIVRVGEELGFVNGIGAIIGKAK